METHCLGWLGIIWRPKVLALSLNPVHQNRLFVRRVPSDDELDC
jgi:hypothetical protein